MNLKGLYKGEDSTMTECQISEYLRDAIHNAKENRRKLREEYPERIFREAIDILDPETLASDIIFIVEQEKAKVKKERCRWYNGWLFKLVNGLDN